ncbi:MAG: ferrous iron transport protein B [Ruminococcus sp.]|jgi:ferrous iron transport protein B|nr:ferrous iron transport protein B [Ruminococcus sp.]
MNVSIALAGNPNSGKTTVFNALTGGDQYVGNWAGVTVEKKTGHLKTDKAVHITDLPGIYALSPYSPEEIVSHDFLMGKSGEKPDVILDIVDASNIERNLYLTTQLAQTGIPIILVLNMMDLVNRHGDKLDAAKLGEALGVPIFEASALHEQGLAEAAKRAVEIGSVSHKPYHERIHVEFSETTAKALEAIKAVAGANMPKTRPAIHFAIDLFERTASAQSELGLSGLQMESIEKIISDAEKALGDDSESIIAKERYDYIAKVLSTCYQKSDRESFSDKIDRFVTNKYLAIPIFAVVMFLVYYISVATIGAIGTNWVNDVLFGEWVPAAVGDALTAVSAAPWLHSLIVDGIIAGVGAVLGFLPQMAVLFLLLSLLEDCGYMSRIAFILDRVFRKFGLSGKSFIPFLVSTGCGVPGIMAARPIEDESQRRITIISTTFMPCSAKLPIIAMIAGGLFGNSAWVAFSAYLAGIAAIILSGLILKGFKKLKVSEMPFVMELPSYHAPRLKNIFRHTWNQLKAFIIKAGTIIFAASVLIWLLSNFGFNDGSFGMVDSEHSILSYIGRVVAPLFIPLGFGTWQMAVASITGIAAKENVVSTLSVLFSAGQGGIDTILSSHLTAPAAYSFLLFNLLCAPCFAAIGAVRREMNSTKWTLFALLYQTAFAYVVSLLVYNIWRLI